MTRQLEWWNEGSGRKLDGLIETYGKRKEDLAAEAGVDRKTIDNWCNNKHVPSIRLLNEVLSKLGATVRIADFKDAADQYRSSGGHSRSAIPPAVGVSHPHAQLEKKLFDHVISRGDPVQFLAPPGFLKTKVLKALEDGLRRAGEQNVVFVSASEVTQIAKFWTVVAEKFRFRGVDVPIERVDDPYDALVEGLETAPCVLLLDGPDRWLVERQAPPKEVNTWVARLVGLPCVKIVSGLIGLNHIPLITGAPDSAYYMVTAEWQPTDGWWAWTSEICRSRGVPSEAVTAALDGCVHRHPRAFVEGVQGWTGGIDAAREKVRQCHLRIGEAILWQLPESLRSILRGGDLRTLNVKSREARALVDAGVLRDDGSGLKAVVPEWAEAWERAT